jgi:outer membrane immunogenic protein
LAQAWTGPYLGTPAGGAWSWSTYNAAAVGGDASGVGGFPAARFSLGIFAGGFAGYNWQRGRIVFGVEAGFGWANVDGQTECGNGVDRGYLCYANLRSYALLTGHVGFVRDQSLLSLTGGLVVGRQLFEVREPAADVVWGTADNRSFGWTIGFANERILSSRFSVRTGVAYVRFPPRDVVLTSPSYPATVLNVAQHYVLASVSVIYRPGQVGGTGILGESNPRADADLGRRVWLSFGRFNVDRYDAADPNLLATAQTFGGYLGFGAESFSHSRTERGFFQSFVAGVGPLAGGTLVAQHTDATTVSELARGRMLYRFNDYGYYFARGPRGSLGAFVGTTWLLELYRAFGCAQAAGGTAVCDPAIPASVDYRTNSAFWVAPRIGLATEFVITDRLTFRGEAAVSPLAFHWSTENQWHSPDMNPIIARGRGFGYQLQAALSYAFTDRFIVSVGGRYWMFHADGSTNGPGAPQRQSTTSRHFNVFLEAAFFLGDG